MSARRIISPTIWLLSLVSLFNDIASEIVIPVMPVFLKSIGFSFFLIGILEGIAEAVAGISKGYFGNLSDSIGKRLPFIQIGYAFSAIAKASFAFFTTTIPVFAGRVTDRIGKGVRTSARDAMLSDLSPDGSKATVFGFHRSMDTVGAAIGSFIALIYLFYHPGNYKTLFLITIIPGIIAVGITFLIKEKTPYKPTSPVPAKKKYPGFFSFFGYWKRADKKYKMLVTGLLFFTLMNSSDAFILLALKQKGFSDTYMIGIYIFYNLVFALLAFPIGKISDKSGMMRTTIIGLLIFSAVYFCISFVHSLIFILLLFFAYGIYAACVDSTTKALITTHCKKKETGTALGLYSSLSSIITILASSWTGFVWMQFGAQTAFIISATGVLLVVVFFILESPSLNEKDLA